jgi:hypothetical protein
MTQATLIPPQKKERAIHDRAIKLAGLTADAKELGNVIKETRDELEHLMVKKGLTLYRQVKVEMLGQDDTDEIP